MLTTLRLSMGSKNAANKIKTCLIILRLGLPTSRHTLNKKTFLGKNDNFITLKVLVKSQFGHVRIALTFPNQLTQFKLFTPKNIYYQCITRIDTCALIENLQSAFGYLKSFNLTLW